MSVDGLGLFAVGGDVAADGREADAPVGLRNSPEILAWSLIMRRSLSAWLLSKGEGGHFDAVESLREVWGCGPEVDADCTVRPPSAPR